MESWVCLYLAGVTGGVAGGWVAVGVGAARGAGERTIGGGAALPWMGVDQNCKYINPHRIIFFVYQRVIDFV